MVGGDHETMQIFGSEDIGDVLEPDYHNEQDRDEEADSETSLLVIQWWD